ncbi:unnamed protein product [Amoebophrya sp. A25]|nr:unnamed protein product [Amoebophrya sp. A25]|eukprot:GSA25T00018766001.1
MQQSLWLFFGNIMYGKLVDATGGYCWPQLVFTACAVVGLAGLCHVRIVVRRKEQLGASGGAGATSDGLGAGTRQEAPSSSMASLLQEAQASSSSSQNREEFVSGVALDGRTAGSEADLSIVIVAGKDSDAGSFASTTTAGSVARFARGVSGSTSKGHDPRLRGESESTLPSSGGSTPSSSEFEKHVSIQNRGRGGQHLVPPQQQPGGGPPYAAGRAHDMSPMTSLRALSSPGLMIDAEIGQIVRHYSRETDTEQQGPRSARLRVPGVAMSGSSTRGARVLATPRGVFTGGGSESSSSGGLSGTLLQVPFNGVKSTFRMEDTRVKILGPAGDSSASGNEDVGAGTESIAPDTGGTVRLRVLDEYYGIDGPASESKGAAATTENSTPSSSSGGGGGLDIFDTAEACSSRVTTARLSNFLEKSPPSRDESGEAAPSIELQNEARRLSAAARISVTEEGQTRSSQSGGELAVETTARSSVTEGRASGRSARVVEQKPQEDVEAVAPPPSAQATANEAKPRPTEPVVGLSQALPSADVDSLVIPSAPPPDEEEAEEPVPDSGSPAPARQSVPASGTARRSVGDVATVIPPSSSSSDENEDRGRGSTEAEMLQRRRSSVKHGRTSRVSVDLSAVETQQQASARISSSSARPSATYELQPPMPTSASAGKSVSGRSSEVAGPAQVVHEASETTEAVDEIIPAPVKGEEAESAMARVSLAASEGVASSRSSEIAGRASETASQEDAQGRASSKKAKRNTKSKNKK